MGDWYSGTNPVVTDVLQLLGENRVLIRCT